MSFLYVSIFDSILIYMVATLIIYVSIELYNFYINKRYTWVNSSSLLKKNVQKTTTVRKYVLRHFNLFKEILNTNKDFLSKRLNMAKRKIQVIIFYSFDCTTDERNLDETYVDRDLIGNKKIPFHHERKLKKIKNRGITR